MTISRPARGNRGWQSILSVRPRWRGAGRRISAALTASAALPMLAGIAAVPGAVSVQAQAGIEAQQHAPVPVTHDGASRQRAKIRTLRAGAPPAVHWPASGSGIASITAHSFTSASLASRDANAARARPSAGSERAGALPVEIGPPDVAGTSATVRVKVGVASHAAAEKAGTSLIVSLVRADNKRSPARVHVSLDYSSFADADWGGAAARLRLVALPACALTTPQVAACRRQVPLASSNDVQASAIGADVTLPKSAATGAMTPLVLALAEGTSGSGGNFSAEPLSGSANWSAGGNSGGFSYSYGLSVPSVPGGLQPSVAFNYDSQSVDGLTSSTNNQASWIGDGWSYDPGYIERDYQSCSGISSLPAADQTGDLCWDSSTDVTTLVLDGTSTTLVNDPANGWHAEADNGAVISYVCSTGTCPSDSGTSASCNSGSTSNGTWDGGYWKIAETDGTTYYFGMNELPGYASGDTTTNSALTVPVYSPQSGDPCYNSAFSDSAYPMAWRWELDYVTDSHGDAMAYFYDNETNYYAADNGTTATASYTQGAALKSIDYGLRAGSVYGATPAAEVNFTAPETRTDIPTSTANGDTDLACAHNAACTVASPSFWSKYQLTTVETEAYNGTALAPVDSWALSQGYETNTTEASPPLWLNSIQRTGEDGSTTVSLPAVSFAWDALANRVNLTDGYDAITRDRISEVVTETGEDITVDYSPPSCPSTLPADDDNTSLCYPSWWTPSNGQSFEDWFNKYVVTSVTTGDGYTTDAQPAVTTSYCYGSRSNCLSGGAWHYDDDTLVRSDQRTWDQWRGFQDVWASTGSNSDPVTETEDQYFQGMNGDYQSNRTFTSGVSLTSVTGGVTVTDSDQYAGTGFEHIVYNGTPTPANIVTDTVSTPWSQQTASEPMPSPLPALTAYLTGVSKAQEFTALASGGNRESDTTYGHNSAGQITWEASAPDAYDDGTAGPASEDTCTQTAYTQPNTTANLDDLPSEVVVTDVTPASCPITYSASSVPQSELVSDTRNYYDGSTTLGAAPTTGNLTQVTEATSYSGTTEEFTAKSTGAYDEYGRATSATDADGNTTTTQYTPATGQEPATVTVTTPPTPNRSAGLTTTTTYDPLRDLPLTVTSPGGQVTTTTYDALGRVTAVWEPTASKAGGQDATDTYSYDVTQSAPPMVTTNTVEPSGTAYLTDETFYDSSGQQVETQDETPDGNTDVTMAFYNSDGWESLAFNSFNTGGGPINQMVSAKDDAVPDQTGYVYDDTGRVTRQITFNELSDEYETDTSYGGNSVTVTPPQGPTSSQGGYPSTTYTNGLGQATYAYQYHSQTVPSPLPAPGSGTTAGEDQTAYTYYPSGQLDTITDAAGNKWSYAYDLAGDQTSQTTPDAGTTTSTYDPNGNLLSATNADGESIAYHYDSNGRKDYECAGTTASSTCGASMLASWVYDTLQAGQLTSSTSYVGGSSGKAYTETSLGYTTAGLSKGTKVTIPTGVTLAGTYSTAYTYANAGELAKYTDTAAGGLPEEAVNIGYDASGDPLSVGSSQGTYVSALSYTELGQPHEYIFGTTADPADLYDSYNYQGQLTEAESAAGVTPVVVDDQNYSYNNDGSIASDADTASGANQVQCFRYDYLGRLQTAWSQGGTSCASSPTTSLESGASAPYWDAYTYNSAGDMTQEVSTPPTGTATTYTNAFPATSGADGPHAIASQTDSGGSTATTTFGYDPAGNTTSITAGSTTDTLNWNASGYTPGELASVTSGSTTVASYVYDASGNLLLQTDGNTTTLYLADEQITSTTTSNGTTTAGTRYYSLGGQTVAARTSGGTIYYLVGNLQGTDTVAINASNLAVTRRYYDPYGNQLGTAPTTWPGTQGFVGGTADPATGLTNIGAREYDPATGTFISTDPELKPDDPQDLDPYAYAEDDPADNSDPSGLGIMGGGGNTCENGGCSNVNWGNSHGNEGTPIGTDPTVPVAPTTTKIGGITLPNSYPNLHKMLVDYKNALPLYLRDFGDTDTPGSEFWALEWMCNNGAYAGACGQALSNDLLSAYRQKTEAIAYDFAGLAEGISNALPGGLPEGEADFDLADDAAATADANTITDDFETSSQSNPSCSFSRGTLVLLASGKAVPISSLKPGDMVMATNTTTGQTSPEKVTATDVHHDTNLYDLKVKTARGVEVIHTTSNHLFFDPSDGKWVQAAGLRVGEPLQGANGTTVTAYGGSAPAVSADWMWDLTVPGGNDHDFYVRIATTSVLVHNTSCRTFGNQSPSGRMDIPNAPGVYKITVAVDGDTDTYVGKASDIHNRIHGAFRAGGALYDLGYSPADVQQLDWMEMEGASDGELFAMENDWIDYEGGIGNLANRINSPGAP